MPFIFLSIPLYLYITILTVLQANKNVQTFSILFFNLPEKTNDTLRIVNINCKKFPIVKIWMMSSHNMYIFFILNFYISFLR